MADFHASVFTKRPSATYCKKTISNGKTSFNDVFGGPPKSSSSSSASRIEDYSEIFGDFYPQYAPPEIPVLDFPHFDLSIDDARTPNFDYSEVFRGLDNAHFPISYDEIFSDDKPSNLSRVLEENNFHQQIPACFSKTSLEESDIDYFACSDGNLSMSNGKHHKSDGAKQFNISYSKASEGGKNDPMATHFAQLNEESGYSYLVDGCTPTQTAKSGKHLPDETGDLNLSKGSNQDTKASNHSSETLSAPVCSESGDIIKTEENDLKLDKKQLESNAAAAVSDHLLQNSDHLNLDGNSNKIRRVFLTVSEINLRTQPSQVPPPSRPPPKLVASQGVSKKTFGKTMKAYSDLGHGCAENGSYLLRTVSEPHRIEDDTKDSPLPCFDVEVDISSAAAASAAAMKEAMEKAEARIRSAKQSMERRRDNLQSRAKPGLNENRREKERMEAEVIKEDNAVKEIHQKMQREDVEKEKLTWDQRHNYLRAAHMVADEGFIELGKETIDKWQPRECGHSSDSNIQLEGTGEWKAEKQFFELVNDNSFKVAKEFLPKVDEAMVSQQDKILRFGEEEKPRAPKEGFEQEDNGRKLKGASKNVFKGEANIRNSKTGNEQDENEDKLKALQEQRVYKGEEMKIKVAEEVCAQDENDKKIKMVQELYNNKENEKRVKTELEACMQEEKKIPNAVREAGGQEEKGKLLSETREHFEQQENGMNLGTSDKAFGKEESGGELETGEDSEKEGYDGGVNTTREVHQQEEKEKRAAQECHKQGDKERVLKVAQDAQAAKSEVNVKTSKENGACKQEHENRLNNRSPEICGLAKNEKGTKAAREVHERQKTERTRLTQDPCSQEENNTIRAVQEACVHEENEKKPKASKSSCDQEENEKGLEAERKAVKQDTSSNMETAQVVYELEENEKLLKAESQVQEVENLDQKLKIVREACVREGDERKKTAQEIHDKVEQDKKLAAADVPHEENEKNHKTNYEEGFKNMKTVSEVHIHENNVKIGKAVQVNCEQENQDKPKDTYELEHEAKKDTEATEEVQEYNSKTKLEANQDESCKSTKPPQEVHDHREGNKKPREAKEAYEEGANKKELKASQGTSEPEGNGKNLTREAQSSSKHEDGKALLQDEDAKKLQDVQDSFEEEKNEKMKAAEGANMQDGNNEKPGEPKEVNGSARNGRTEKESQVSCESEMMKQTGERGQNDSREADADFDCDANNNQSKTSQAVFQWLETVKKLKAAQQSLKLEEKQKLARTTPVVSASQDKEQKMGAKIEEKERDRVQRERELEMERLRKAEEEREREREREKDRIAVERANREARDRAFAEARERAERIAVERVTAEARQRAITEARERAERASAEARDRYLAEKASLEARQRLERAAVERATAEARERAAERAKAEARERAERSCTKEDGGMRQNSSIPDARDISQAWSESDSTKRCKARLERHQRTVERAARALAEKNKRDILAQRELAERNRLADSLDADIRRWSNGKEGNLRALLSTLQYILGPESGWQPVPLTDVITAAAVKKAYRKATLSVHPDKVQQRGASIQQKYICEKVFDLLQEAWNKFNSQEQ